MPPEFMDTRQVARYLKVNHYTIYRYRHGKGVKNPLPFIRLNPRKIVYDLRAIRLWLRTTMIERPNGDH